MITDIADADIFLVDNNNIDPKNIGTAISTQYDFCYADKQI